MPWLVRLAARLPLRFFHGLGVLLGWAVYLASPRYARRLRENLAQSGLARDRAAFRRLLAASIAEAGRALAELVVIWGRPLPQVVALVRECHGWEHVEAARATGRGIVFLTPHLGCFEVAALYGASRMPLTVLFRPPRLRWLAQPMIAGRGRGGLTLAPTDVPGVRRLYAALKRGEAVGILPDQVPARGEGVWVPFFGRPAYTMTLASRLASKTGAVVLLAFAERLAAGRGFRLTIRPLEGRLGGGPESDARLINAAIESLVRLRPEQYLWSYNRYKGVRDGRQGAGGTA